MAGNGSDESHHHRDNIFSSVISDIRTYSGEDPLLPWLRGIRRMRESLSPQLLKEKLPRFLQKCTQKFQSDRRYRNDLRYLRVWLQLMDYVEDPKVLLTAMQMSQIGIKHSLFYQAYALYYEKIKKFEEAEKIYHLGVQNLAEPIGELQKSYEQFLWRMERHKIKRIKNQDSKSAKENMPGTCSRLNGIYHENHLSVPLMEDKKVDANDVVEGNYPIDPSLLGSASNGVKLEMENFEQKQRRATGVRNISEPLSKGKELEGPAKVSRDDKVVVKFVDTAIIGKSDAEDACHHGLVEPTINMKEAMNAINSMFSEPIETKPVVQRSSREQERGKQSSSNGFEIFIDEDLEKEVEESQLKKGEKSSLLQHPRSAPVLSVQEGFEIYTDEGKDEIGDGKDNANLEQDQVQNETGGFISSTSHAFVFPRPKDLVSENSDELIATSSIGKFREDTVVRKFVGSTILDEEPAVENVCHHGLVDPTINLKEAMDDINNMFGKPIDFVRTRRSKKQDKAPRKKEDPGGFVILADDEPEDEKMLNPKKSAGKILEVLPDNVKHAKEQLPVRSSSRSYNIDLFEPTIFTKEAMDDINNMFGMPLDF